MTDIWNRLERNRRATEGRRILSLFDDPGRMAAFSAEADGLLLDISKTNIDADALALLGALAKARGVAERREAMFAGERVNRSEDRPALHAALRGGAGAALTVDGVDVAAQVETTLARMEAFAEGVRGGALAAPSGRRFQSVVNIGIGGSDLGPAMACEALAPYADGPRAHFVSNVDGAHLADTLARLDPETTLFVLASKTCDTVETMENAAAARDWLRAAVGERAAAGHFAAATTRGDRAVAFGVPEARVFTFGEWVGGRHSDWGPVGLSVMLAVGPARFREFLAGGRAMDAHFRAAPFARNLPVLLATVGVWHRNVCGHPTRAVLPYDQRLARLPVYLQQLDMESNGKRVTEDGAPLSRASGPVVWGAQGTNAQHAFFQMLHQGTDIVPCEFLIAARGHEPHLARQHEILKASCLAQSEALMRGRSFEEAKAIAAAEGFEGEALRAQAAQRCFPGNRPSVTIAYDRLTPFTLGQIIALYEHRVFVEGVIWGVDSFDQWGVELGKEMTRGIVEGGLGETGLSPSTRALMRRLGGEEEA